MRVLGQQRVGQSVRVNPFPDDHPSRFPKREPDLAPRRLPKQTQLVNLRVEIRRRVAVHENHLAFRRSSLYA